MSPSTSGCGWKRSIRACCAAARVSSFVDIEGTIVWTQEYLRYRVNGCGHPDAIARVTSQILGQGVQPVCSDFTGATVNFPPRDQPFAFRQELERLYRDVLRRGAVQTFVDTEGDIVWTQEYLRYRVNNCSHTEAVDRVLAQTLGAAVQPYVRRPAVRRSRQHRWRRARHELRVGGQLRQLAGRAAIQPAAKCWRRSGRRRRQCGSVRRGRHHADHADLRRRP